MIAVFLVMFGPLLTATRRRPATPVQNVLWACFYIGCLSIAAARLLAQWRPL